MPVALTLPKVDFAGNVVELSVLQMAFATESNCFATAAPSLGAGLFCRVKVLPKHQTTKANSRRLSKWCRPSCERPNGCQPESKAGIQEFGLKQKPSS